MVCSPIGAPVYVGDVPRRCAVEAGFSSCETLPIENDFWRFYLLRP